MEYVTVTIVVLLATLRKAFDVLDSFKCSGLETPINILVRVPLQSEAITDVMKLYHNQNEINDRVGVWPEIYI